MQRAILSLAGSMVTEYEPRVPEGVDVSRPSIARIVAKFREPMAPGSYLAVSAGTSDLVSLPEWRPDDSTDRTPLRGPTLGAVAQLRK